MSEIPDFTDSQVWTVVSTLQERYPDLPVELPHARAYFALEPQKQADA